MSLPDGQQRILDGIEDGQRARYRVAHFG